MASYLIEVVPSALTMFVNETKEAKIVYNTNSIQIQKSIDIADTYIKDDFIVVTGLKLGSAFINIQGYDNQGDYVTGYTLTINVVKNEIIETVDLYKPSLDYFKMMFKFFDYETVLTDSNNANFETNIYNNDNKLNQSITDSYLSMLIDEQYFMMKTYIENNGYEEPTITNKGAIQPLKDYICFLVAYKLCFRYAVNSDYVLNIKEERDRILQTLQFVLSKKTKSGYNSVKLYGEIKKP